MLKDGFKLTRHHWLLALGILTALTTIYAVWRDYSPVPFGDQWDGGIGFYLRATQHPFSAFFEQHNEHRLAFSRLLFFSDIRYFGGRNVSLLIGNLVLTGLLALTIYRVTVHHIVLQTSQRAGLAGAILMVTFSWIQSENFTWGFQNQWFAVYLFALCAFHAIDLSSEAANRNDSARANGWLAVALVSSIFAAYSMSSGVLVFPVLGAQALYRRLGLPRIAVIAAVAILVWIAYFITWQAPASSGSLASALHTHPLGLIKYLILYLGSPAKKAHLGWTGAYISGSIVLLTLAIHGIHLLSNLKVQIKSSALLAFGVFIVGNAFITACGRLWFGLDTAFSSRYTTASLACWITLAIFTLLNARSAFTRHVTIIVAAVVMLMLISVQPLKSNQEQIYARAVAGLALRAHVYDAALTQAIYPFPEPLTAIAKDAETAHISIFSPDQTDFYQAPANITESTQCEGHIETLSTTSTAGVLVLTGWIYDPVSRSVPQAIVITDVNGKTLGTGVAGGDRGDIHQRYGSRARHSQWTAFFTATPGTIIRVNGKVSNLTFCQIADDTPSKRAP